LEDDVIQIITHYCTFLPEKSNDFREPSLSFLAKYWQDPVADVQQAARSLILASLVRMTKEQKIEIVDYWIPLLPYGNSPKKSKNISAIILGIIGAELPDHLSPPNRQKVARSLISLMSDESLDIIRVSTADLIGKGYVCWKGNTNDTAVIKLLFSHAFPKKQTTPLLTALTKTSKQSLILIADCVPQTFVQVLTTDMMTSKASSDRIGALKLISLIIKKRPLVLSLFLPKIVQSIIDLLDPSVPQMRESLLTQTTATLHDLVMSYPSIGFHGNSQKLAVGTNDGGVVIYDLKTATKWLVFEGHIGPVSAVSFSKEGSLLLSFSTVDLQIRIWQTTSSFLGIFGSNSGKCLKAIKVPQFNKSPVTTIESVRFEWLSPKRVVLYNGQEEPYNFNI